MLSRGHFIGEIIDELSTIANQVDIRCRLGLTDLNIHLENFFKDLLNSAFKLELKNLNTGRSNEPGLDLGDKAQKIAFQITSIKTSNKVNETLRKITAAQEAEYNTVFVLIVSHKQGSYTLDDELCRKYSFSDKENIWDIDTIASRCLSLPLDQLKDVYDLIRRDCARIRTELEIPDEEGQYATNVADFMEILPSIKIGTCENLAAWVVSTYQAEVSGEDYATQIQLLLNSLNKLPRITRDFYATLLDQINDETEFRLNKFVLNYAVFSRKCRYPNLDEELTILYEHGLAWQEYPDSDELPKSPTIIVYSEIDGNPGLVDELIRFCRIKRLPLHKMIVNLNFSEL